MSRRRIFARSLTATVLAFFVTIMPLGGWLGTVLPVPTAQAVAHQADFELGPPNFTSVNSDAFVTTGSLGTRQMVFDVASGVLYSDGSGSDLNRCDTTSTDCTDTANWTTYSIGIATSLVSLEEDVPNEVLYAGGGVSDGNIYRCDLASDCDASGDWTLADTAGDSGAAAVLDFAVNNGVIYAAALAGSNSHVIIRCVTSSGCNSDGDWNAFYFGGGGDIANLVVADPATHVLWIGLHDASVYGYLIYCDQDTNGCNEPSDFSQVDLPHDEFDQIPGLLAGGTVDTANHILYLSLEASSEGESGRVFRCDISADACDAQTDFAVSYATPNFSGNDVRAILYDTVHGWVYISANGTVYRCNPDIDACQSQNDWRFVGNQGADSFGHDTTHDILYSGDAACDQGTISQCKFNEFDHPSGSLARSTAYDSVHDRLFVADRPNNRVFVYDLSSVENGLDPIHVLGQPDYESNSLGGGATGLNYPNKIAYDNVHDRLFVSDSHNNRVLEYDTSGTITDGMAAEHELGQANFSDVDANRGGPAGQNTLSDPEGVSVDGLNNFLYVSDTANARVLVFALTDGEISDGDDATDVYGQGPGTDYTTTDSGNDNQHFDLPSGLFVETNNDMLWVADYNNSRVMGFPVGNHTASVEYGQADFGQSDCNRDGSSNLTVNTLCNPDDVTLIQSDGADQRLLVVDSGNGRVLVFDTSGGNISTSGMDAVDVYGVPDFTTIGGAGPSQSSLQAPEGVDYDEANNRLFVADWGHSRVMFFGYPTGQGPATPGDGEITGVCTGWPSPHVEIAWSANPPPGEDPPDSNSVVRAVDFSIGNWFFGGNLSSPLGGVGGTQIDGTPVYGSDPPNTTNPNFTVYDLRDNSVLVGHTYSYHAKYSPSVPSSNTYTVTINADNCGGTPPTVLGGHLSTNSDFLTSSAPSAVSDHTIRFVAGTSIPNGGKIVYTFDPAFDMSALTKDDLSFFYNVHAPLTLGDDCSGSEASAVITGNVVTITLCSGGGAEISQFALTVLLVQNGHVINPPTVGTYGIRLAAYDDSDNLIGEDDPFVAIVYPVDLNANVNATFTFIVDGEDAGGTIDDEVVASASSPLYVGFGTLTPATPVTMGSSLSVTTNAANGFVVTIEQNHNMLASSGADIDSFKDGATQYPAATWTAPTGTLGSEKTYGHLGITTEDSSAISAGASVSTDSDGEFIGLVAGTPRTIWSYDGPSDGMTDDIGHIDVGYRVEIMGLQEAGRYQNRLMYIATPTF